LVELTFLEVAEISDILALELVLRARLSLTRGLSVGGVTTTRGFFGVRGSTSLVSGEQLGL